MSENFKTINLNQSQYEYLERAVKMWKEEKNYKLKNNLVFGIISEIDYIMFGGSKDGKN